MEKSQELEWQEAQKIAISVDLVAAAKKQLQFLAAVDRNRCLHEGPALQRAIYRYKACWLPLLAKHTESSVLEGPLVVPLDCEWIWHCHRLNPVQYKADCQEFYGQILDNRNVVSVVQGISKEQTVEIWSSLYPKEPYEIDFSSLSLEGAAERFAEAERDIKYDFVSAVRRQSSFFYQISRPHMHDSRFLEGAIARYKGFLHLIKRNRERSLRRFCVPTYDIDLIWHSHQLQPSSYCKDLITTLGKVLEHDDTDSDRTKGKKLDTGFSETTKQWEETFGLRYWRAGAMYRGNAPSPVTVTPWHSKHVGKSVALFSEHEKYLQLSKTMVLEVSLEFVRVKGLPAGHSGSLFVSFSKSEPDIFFSGKKRQNIFSESGEKQVATFQCEPTGELVFSLMCNSMANLLLPKAAKIIGTTSVSLQSLLTPDTQLSVEKLFKLAPQSTGLDSKPVFLHVAMSCTIPTVAPHVFHMVKSHPRTCFFPLPVRIQQFRRWTCIVDGAGDEILSLQVRNSNEAGREQRELVGVIGCSSETRVLAEYVGTGWSFVDSHWFLQFEKKSSQERYLIDLRGDQQVKLFRGRRLEFEPKCCNNQKNELDFITAVGFSEEDPYGKAIALLNLKSGRLKVNEERFVLPGVLLLYLLSDLLRKEGYNGIVISEETGYPINKIGECKGAMEAELVSDANPVEGEDCCKDDNNNIKVKGAGCGGCGAGCGGCGGGCGNVIKSGGCGGCGAGCGGCGGGCGNAVKSGGCGGCGGGGCGGCGGGCGGGRRNGWGRRENQGDTHSPATFVDTKTTVCVEPVANG